MIIPHPESDLSTNLMVLGADIIESLSIKKRKDRYVLVELLLSEFLKADQKRTPDMFIHSLIFLYSVGLIDRKDYKVKLITQTNEQLNLF